jgi:hypothetical protein
MDNEIVFFHESLPPNYIKQRLINNTLDELTQIEINKVKGTNTYRGAEIRVIDIVKCTLIKKGGDLIFSGEVEIEYIK